MNEMKMWKNSQL